VLASKHSNGWTPTGVPPNSLPKHLPTYSSPYGGYFCTAKPAIVVKVEIMKVGLLGLVGKDWSSPVTELSYDLTARKRVR
jgi:hypothetical protein